MAFRKLKQLRSLGVILDSSEMEEVIGGLADEVLAHVSDSNAAFMSSLDAHTFHTLSGRGVKRVVGQIGANPVLGARVEAQRGPLARALGSFSG